MTTEPLLTFEEFIVELGNNIATDLHPDLGFVLILFDKSDGTRGFLTSEGREATREILDIVLQRLKQGDPSARWSVHRTRGQA